MTNTKQKQKESKNGLLKYRLTFHNSPLNPTKKDVRERITEELGKDVKVVSFEIIGCNNYVSNNPINGTKGLAQCDTQVLVKYRQKQNNANVRYFGVVEARLKSEPTRIQYELRTGDAFEERKAFESRLNKKGWEFLKSTNTCNHMRGLLEAETRLDNEVITPGIERKLVYYGLCFESDRERILDLLKQATEQKKLNLDDLKHIDLR